MVFWLDNNLPPLIVPLSILIHMEITTDFFFIKSLPQLISLLLPLKYAANPLSVCLKTTFEGVRVFSPVWSIKDPLRASKSNKRGKVFNIYNFNINTWYNVCATYTPTSYTYYVNGNSLGTVLYSSLPDYAPITMGNPYLISGSTAVSADLNAINIGCDMQDTVDTPFFGYINNVGIYNRTLSPSEVLQNYNAIRHMYGQW